MLQLINSYKSVWSVEEVQIGIKKLLEILAVKVLSIQRFQTKDLFCQIELKEKWKMTKIPLYNRDGSFFRPKIGYFILQLFYKVVVLGLSIPKTDRNAITVAIEM